MIKPLASILALALMLAAAPLSAQNYAQSDKEALSRIKSVNGKVDKLTGVNWDNVAYGNENGIRWNEEDPMRIIKLGGFQNGDLSGALSLGGLDSLTTCDVSNNQLSALDVSRNTALVELDASSNQLSALDVSRNTALVELKIYGNHLSSLDVSRNTALVEINAYGNHLNSLDVSRNAALVGLGVLNNQLSALDVSQNAALVWLDASYNKLSALDVSRNAALISLHVPCNQLRTSDAVNVSQNAALETLDVSENQLSSLDVSRNPALKRLKVFGNPLGALDVSANPALERLEASDSQFSTLDVSRNAALTHLTISNNQLSTLDVSHNPALARLDVAHNQLAVLDMSQNPVLNALEASGNQLSALNVSTNPALFSLDVSDNKLSELDVSQSTSLKSLLAGNNQLSELDMSRQPVLAELDISGNNISTLDLKWNGKLNSLLANYNPLKSLRLSRRITGLNTLGLSGVALNINDLKSPALDNLRILYLDQKQYDTWDLTSFAELDHLRLHDLDALAVDLTTPAFAPPPKLAGLTIDAPKAASLNLKMSAISRIAYLNLAAGRLEAIEAAPDALFLKRLSVEENRLPLSQLAPLVAAWRPPDERSYNEQVAPQRQVFFQHLAGARIDLNAWLPTERRLLGQDTILALVTADEAEKIDSRTDPATIKTLTSGEDYSLSAGGLLTLKKPGLYNLLMYNEAIINRELPSQRPIYALSGTLSSDPKAQAPVGAEPRHDND